MPTLNQQIQAHIDTFVIDLSALVRDAAVASVREALGAGATLRRSSNRRSSVATVVHAVPPTKRSATNIGGRRSPERIAATVKSVYDHIKAHPSIPSEKLRTDLKLPRTAVRDALDRLFAEKKLSQKGTRRGAKYTAK